ncbi:uncharacterized protein [Clytia hemisphaerica]|uniref:uncharacterized protein n=1 Tax=Clytia hemisphaerica TaxID=252671 RepID=UPI0034D39E3C
MSVQRTLRDGTVRNGLRNFLIPIFKDRFYIVSIRCLWDVVEKDLGVAAYNIDTKRLELENIVDSFENVVAYFSCTCAMESNNLREELKKKRDVVGYENDNEFEDYDEDDSLIPGVAFWIALSTTKHGASKFETEISKKIMLAGLNVTSCRPIQTRGQGKIGTEEAYTRSLCQVLKDHNSTKLMNKAMHFYWEAVRIKAYKRDRLSLLEKPVFSEFEEGEPLAKLKIRPTLPENIKEEILKTIDDMKIFKINFSLDVSDTLESSEVSAKFIPTDPICIAVDHIERHMRKKNYAISQGKIYKKAPDSQFTYVYCITVPKYLKKLLGIAKIANKLASHITAVSNLLSDPDCGLIKPIKILYNIIEVLPEGIFNSFPDAKTRTEFLQKYYQLLLHRKFPMKEPKLILQGESDSGKTSWAAPFDGIISTENIAGVTQEGKFAGHLINNQTELVFMDEWTVNSLSCEDAKRILQGGLVMLAQKHASATKVMYNSGFFITTNVLPNFGISLDHDAVYSRLKVFMTKPLPKKDSSVTKWLRTNCMQVFHYCAEVLKETPLFETCDDAYVFAPATGAPEEEGAVYNDYDGAAHTKLVALSDFHDEEDELDSSQAAISQIHEQIIRDPLIDDEDIDYYFLESDEANPARWSKEHNLFSTEKNTTHYRLAINTLTYMSEDDWKKVPIHCDDIKRYLIRKRRKWRGADTFYEAWLIRESRKQTTVIPETPEKATSPEPDQLLSPAVTTSTPLNKCVGKSSAQPRIIKFSPLKRKRQHGATADKRNDTNNDSDSINFTTSTSEEEMLNQAKKSKTNDCSPSDLDGKSKKSSKKGLPRLLFTDSDSDDELPERKQKSQKLPTDLPTTSTAVEDIKPDLRQPPCRKTASEISNPIVLSDDSEEDVKPTIRRQPCRKTESKILNPISLSDESETEGDVEPKKKTPAKQLPMPSSAVPGEDEDISDFEIKPKLPRIPLRKTKTKINNPISLVSDSDAEEEKQPK